MARRVREKRLRRQAYPARRVVPTFNANLSRLPRRHVLSHITDYRRYHPRELHRPYRSVIGRIIRPGHIIRSTPYRPAVARRPFPLLADLSARAVLPRDAVICARRRMREEVMHALGHAGRGGQRKPRFNNRSDVRCRR